jgi:hypothetical protein
MCSMSVLCLSTELGISMSPVLLVLLVLPVLADYVCLLAVSSCLSPQKRCAKINTPKRRRCRETIKKRDNIDLTLTYTTTIILTIYNHSHQNTKYPGRPHPPSSCQKGSVVCVYGLVSVFDEGFRLRTTYYGNMERALLQDRACFHFW